MPEETKNASIQISTVEILKIALIFAALYAVYYLRDIILMLLVAMFLAALIDPFADWFSKRKIPRVAAVLVIYLIIVAILSLAIVLIVPPLLKEFSDLTNDFTKISDQIGSVFVSLQEISKEYGIDKNFQQGLQSLTTGLYEAIASAVGTISGFFGWIVSFTVVLVLTFYMVAEETAAKHWFHSLAPQKYQPYLIDLISRVQRKIGSWLRGELVLMATVGFFSYICLLILGVDYALILALIAGLAEIVPYVGPVVAAIPAVILAFAQSPTKAVFVIILYIVIQQLEGQLLVPKVMQRAVGLNPIVSIIALLIGAQLAGIVGALMAIPVATALSVLMQDFLEARQNGLKANSQ